MMVQALGLVETVMNMPSGMKLTGMAIIAAEAIPFGVSRMIAAISNAARSALNSRMATTERSTLGPTNSDITL